MIKKIFVLMLVSMFLLVTLQSISAVETKTGVTTSNEDEITPKPSTGGTATVLGEVWCYGERPDNEIVWINSWPWPIHYMRSTYTNEGKYRIDDVPAGRKVGFLGIRNMFFMVDCRIERMGAIYRDTVILSITEPGEEYRVDLDLEYWEPHEYETEPLNPIEITEGSPSNN
jgi:hypothetical protein